MIVPILLELSSIRSVVDVGCGDGTWLSVFAANGVTDYQGYDGEYVDTARLLIPPDRFAGRDLSRPFKADRRYDLAVSLEVAEHLPESSAPGFIQSLTELAPAVMFSAAIPNQLGTGHVNEQWPDYWSAMFDALGYVAIDCIRPRVWRAPGVAWWYAQNTILYSTREWAESHPSLASAFGSPPARLVRPELFEKWIARALSPRLRDYVKGRLGAITRRLAPDHIPTYADAIAARAGNQ